MTAGDAKSRRRLGEIELANRFEDPPRSNDLEKLRSVSREVIKSLLERIPDQMERKHIEAVLADCTIRNDLFESLKTNYVLHCGQHRAMRGTNRHPVGVALLGSLISHEERFLRDPGPHPAAEVALKKMNELRRWLFREPKWDRGQELYVGDTLVSQYGWSYSEVPRMIRRLRQARGGRPLMRRWLAIRGLELRLLDPSLGWRDITERICDCGKSLHDDWCIQCLKSAVSELRNLLRKYDLLMDLTPKPHKR